jgi:hypothetical protein
VGETGPKTVLRRAELIDKTVSRKSIRPLPIWGRSNLEANLLPGVDPGITLGWFRAPQARARKASAAWFADAQGPLYIVVFAGFLEAVK